MSTRYDLSDEPPESDADCYDREAAEYRPDWRERLIARFPLEVACPPPGNAGTPVADDEPATGRGGA